MGCSKALQIVLVAGVLMVGCGSDPGEGGTAGDVTLNYSALDADGSGLGDGRRRVEEMKAPGEVALPSDSSSPLPDLSPDLIGGPDVSGCFPNCSDVCSGDGCGEECGPCDAASLCQIPAGCLNGVCQYSPVNCDDGAICTEDTCDEAIGCKSTPAPGPCSWPGNWYFEPQNPVLSPTAGAQPQGADNIYAPDVIYFQGQWWMYYGGQGGDGHDAVFLARSNDLVSWQKHPFDGNPQPVVDHGNSNHVNDPSVVLVNGTLYMYYTEAPVGEEDEIHLATSTDGLNWSKQGKVLDVGAPGSWEPDRVGRPSVLYEQGQFRMWYDGQIYGVARHVGYATSADGYSWTKHPDNPILQNQGAVDVDRVGDWYVLLSEAGNGTNLFVAKDPLKWTSLGPIWGKSGEAWDQFGQVTPFLLTANGKAVAILFGGASDACWCKNRIALAWPDDNSCEPACAGAECGPDGCGGSCGKCPDGEKCSQGQCEAGSPPCSGCLDGYANCKEACQHAGHPGGHCAAPDSTDPTECCSCDPATGCEGCLVGASSCMEACQGAGMSYGWCAEPGSQEPSACCACQ